MAVIEIGKIQVRRGQENQTGIPQLDGGEFAWAADTERLYIGLRRADGGSRDDNVEILTENHLKNFFQISYTSSTYVYREGTLITAPLDDPFTESQRTVQQKLDDIVNIKDFGVIGDGDKSSGVLQWDMARLQLAIDRLFLDTQALGSSYGHPRKKLYFPAGTYNFTSTLYIPAYTTIIGDGIGKTIFNLTTTTSFADGLIKTCDLSSVGNGLALGYKHFDAGAGSGSEFSNTGTAKFVTIQDLTMKFDSTGTTVTNAMTLLSLDCADYSVVKNVEFVGNYTSGVTPATTSGYIGLNLRGKLSNGTNINTVIDNCVFRNLHSGIRSDWDIKSTVISNNEFNNLVKGINFNNPIQGFLGPRFVKIENNRFDQIDTQALYVGTNNSSTGSFIISQNNTYERVGFTTAWGDLGQTGTTAIITFASDNNSTINDFFRREVVHQLYKNLTNVYYKPLVEGRTIIDSPNVQYATIAKSGWSKILRMPFTEHPHHLKVQYNLRADRVWEYETTIEQTVVNSATFTVAWSTGMGLGTFVEGPAILEPNRVQGVNMTISQVTLVSPINAVPGQLIRSVWELDRIGELNISVQDHDALTESSVVDNYHYVIHDGAIDWRININNTGTYYDLEGRFNSFVAAKVSFPATVPIEFSKNIKI